jgi:3-methyl-2-oxobutanoate hydroxymethyltransferase
MAETLASKITADVKVPTIRIGASTSCDRQILVKEDMMGFAPRPAKFVKVYADIPVAMDQAIAS